MGDLISRYELSIVSSAGVLDATHDMSEHKDRLLPTLLEFLEQHQWFLVIAQTSFWVFSLEYVVCNLRTSHPNSPVFPKHMNKAYIFQSSLILYFFSAAGRTFQHGSSRVTRNDFAALLAASLAFDLS
jgi:lipid-A-disaccharide synthase-like uncharacterized protein